jgi:hypothetical protein
MAFNFSGAALPTYAAKDVAITQRPTSTAILAIDSEDRYKTYPDARAGSLSPYSFTINKAESLMNGFFTRLALTEVVFPWVIPNVNRRTRRMLVNYTAGGPIAITTITIPVGFYTPSALAAAVQAAVRAITPGLNVFTMTYGAPSSSGPLPAFSYATNNASTIGFAPVAPDAALDISVTTKQLFDLLGFIDGNNTVLQTSGAGGLTFCQATRYVDIVCTQLTNNQALKDTMSQEIARTVICRLYLGDANISGDVVPSSSTFCPPGCAPYTIYRDYASPKQIAWMPNQPVGGFLRFEVYDDNGDLLTGSDAFSFGANRTDWSITMLVTEN